VDDDLKRSYLDRLAMELGLVVFVEDGESIEDFHETGSNW
jgi:hypothetical protein